MNLYQAFGGNPVNFVDPWGEAEKYGSLFEEYEIPIREANLLIHEFGKRYGGFGRYNPKDAYEISLKLGWIILQGRLTVEEFSGSYGEARKISQHPITGEGVWKLRLSESFLEEGNVEHYLIYPGSFFRFGSVKDQSNASRVQLLLTLFHEGFHVKRNIDEFYTTLRRIQTFLFGGPPPVPMEFEIQKEEFIVHGKTIKFARYLRWILKKYQSLLKNGSKVPTSRSSSSNNLLLDHMEPLRRYFTGAKFSELFKAIRVSISQAQKARFDIFGSSTVKSKIKNLISKHGRPKGGYYWFYDYNSNKTPKNPLERYLYNVSKEWGVARISISRTGESAFVFSGK